MPPPTSSHGSDRAEARLPARVRAGLGVIGLVGALAAGLVAPSLANATHHRSCDAVCAMSAVHQPGKVTVRSVHWKRYPYAAQPDPLAIDRWGSTERQCTGYATWALNRLGVDFGVTDLSPNGRVVNFLSASGWARAARQGAWTVSHRPVIDSIAQWKANETSHWQVKGVRDSARAGRYGHVGIVTKVYRDGTVLVRQYNAGEPGRSYSTMRTKAPRYLYLGVK